VIVLFLLSVVCYCYFFLFFSCNNWFYFTLEMDNMSQSKDEKCGTAPEHQSLLPQVACSASSLPDDVDDAASSSSFASSLSSSTSSSSLPKFESKLSSSSLRQTQFRRHQSLNVVDDDYDYVYGDAAAAHEDITHAISQEDYDYDMTSSTLPPQPQLQLQTRMPPPSVSSTLFVDNDDFGITPSPQLQRQPHLDNVIVTRRPPSHFSGDFGVSIAPLSTPSLSHLHGVKKQK
jgi:hypothetical protein